MKAEDHSIIKIDVSDGREIMVTFDASNSHFEYMDVTRHWSPNSQKYAGGDALITFLSSDWALQEIVFYEEHWLAGGRVVTVYYFELKRNGEELIMPVLVNPYVNRMVISLPLQLKPLAERDLVQVRKAS